MKKPIMRQACSPLQCLLAAHCLVTHFSPTFTPQQAMQMITSTGASTLCKCTCCGIAVHGRPATLAAIEYA
eukprot:2003959-Amphidinium_carterae.2